jgi:hypothetical protein
VSLYGAASFVDVWLGLMPRFRIEILIIFLAAWLAQSAMASEPARPSNPKSQQDCLTWGSSYQSYWDDTISKARQRDSKCKSSYSGSYNSVRSYCANTSAQVEYQNPCDEATMWTQCEWAGYFHGMGACLTGLAHDHAASTAKGVPEKKDELDSEDIALLKKIASDDQFIRGLARAGDTAEALAKALGYVVPGPGELLVKWDQTLIAGWRKSNKALDTFNKYDTCQSIIARSLDTKAIYFFQQLYEARGCDNY